MYWALESNTPFYGWGMAGRVETTALAVQALIHDRDNATDVDMRNADDDLINHGLLFLLRKKDRYGVWYSTQATVNVYEAITSLATADARVEREMASGTAASAEIVINGRPAATVQLPDSKGFANPLIFDATEFLSNGPNQAKFDGYEVALTSVDFEKGDYRINQEISCHVNAERVGFKGYGMLLAEIGLPPGAELDRASMEHAITTAGFDIGRYDILPDRLIVYIWPRAGGTRFDFKIRPRFGMNAQSAPSTLYDYYNPDSRFTVKPTRFVIK